MKVYSHKLTIVSTRRMRLAFRACVTQGEFGVSVIFCLITNKTQYPSDDIPHDHFPGLCSHQTSSHPLHPLNQLGRIGGSTRRDDTKEKVGRRSST